MRAKIAIFALVAAFACTGLPSKAIDKNFENKLTVVGILAAVDCFVRNKGYDPEQANKIIEGWINENPHLKVAYTWGTASDKATEAVHALRPYFKSECNDLTLSAEEANRLVAPYLE